MERRHLLGQCHLRRVGAPRKEGKTDGVAVDVRVAITGAGRTAKFTGVAGWDAVARLVRGRRMRPVASAPTRSVRRVSMGCLLCMTSVVVAVATSASLCTPSVAVQGWAHQHADDRAPCGASIIA